MWVCKPRCGGREARSRVVCGGRGDVCGVRLWVCRLEVAVRFYAWAIKMWQSKMWQNVVWAGSREVRYNRVAMWRRRCEAKIGVAHTKCVAECR